MLILRVASLTLLVATSAGCGDAAPSAASPPPPPAPASIGRSSVADNPAGWPPIEFEPATLDFGLLAPGGAGEGEIRIWNVGDTPLRILASATSCGCTTTDNIRGHVIPPGEALTFGTSMKMKSGLGKKHEKIQMVFEGHRETVVKYDVRAEVSLPIRATPAYLTATETTSGTFEVASLDGQPFRVLASNGAAPVFVGFDPEQDAPRSRYTLEWSLADAVTKDAVPWFWVVETDRPDAALVDLRVRHDLTRPYRRPGQPWVLKDRRVIVDAIENGVPFEINTSIEYGADQRPAPQTVAVVSTSPLVSAELREARADGQLVWIRIGVTMRDAPPGLLSAQLRVGGSGHMSELFVIGRVR